MKKLILFFVAVALILGFADWWATRRCCGGNSFLAQAKCCAAGRDCSKPGACPSAKASGPPIKTKK